MFAILIFLLAIIAANLSVAYFGPVSTPINAFLLIGLDLSLRDHIHDKWHGNNLGLKNQRKLVPTRWAITAVDDIIAKNLISAIKNYQKIDYSLYFGSYLGDYYMVLFFPEIWQYELFETYLPRSSWNQSQIIQSMTDYEPYKGRKSYAEQTGGGYYAGLYLSSCSSRQIFTG